MRARLNRILVNVIITLSAIIVITAVTEIGIRLFMPWKHFAATVNTWDAEVGTKQMPNAKGFVVCPEYEIDMIINSKGLRDREFTYQKPERTERILVLGDSFACGYGVQTEETFAKVLEDLLNSDAGTSSNWEVLNGAIGSTGTAHQLSFFKTEGHKYDPDYVVLCFCLSNDFWDNITSGLYSLQDGELVKHDAPLTGARKIQRYTNWIPGYNTMFARSHLLNFVKYRVSAHHRHNLSSRIQETHTESEIVEDEEEITQALVLSLSDACADIGCRFILTVVPSYDDCDFDGETTRLVRYATAVGIPFVDVRPRLRRAMQEGVRVHYKRDGHWTRDGHRLAAETLYEFFNGVDVPADQEAKDTHQDT